MLYACLVISGLFIFVGFSLYTSEIWTDPPAPKPNLDSAEDFWMEQAAEKDLVIQRLRAELAIQTDIAAKARHAVQSHAALCHERHVDKPLI